MSELYVPDKAFLVCTSGMKMQQIKVNSQSSIRIANGRLIATIKDRSGGNFMCAKMIIAGAILVAIVVAIVIIAAPAAITIGAGAALAAGAAGGAALGGLASMIPCICAGLTMSHDWAPVHPKVLIEKKQALIEKSKVHCILGGDVLIHYSEAAAHAAIDIKRKETVFNVAFIIAAAYLAGPAVEGVSSAVSSIRGLSAVFRAQAIRKYVGSVGVGFATNFSLDYLKDMGKDKVYESIGVKKYVEGEDTDLERLKETEQSKEADNSSLYDNSKRAGEAADSGVKGVGDRTGNFETLDHQSRTVLNSSTGGIEEYRSDRVSNATPGAIPERNTQTTTAHSSDFYSDQSGTYMNDENLTRETGREFRPLSMEEHRNLIGKTAIGYGKDYISKPEISSKGIEKGGLVVDIMVDAYKGITRYIVSKDVENYLEALKTSEREARKTVTVIENQV